MEDEVMTNNLKDKTRDELRVIAKALEIEGRGQMRKPELIAAIEKYRRDLAEVEKAAMDDIEAMTEPDGQMKAQMSAYARLIASIQAKRERKAAKKGELVPNRAERRARGLRGKNVVRRKVAGVMPLHYRGRAIGAKHLNIRVAAGRSNEEFMELTIPMAAPAAKTTVGKPARTAQTLSGADRVKSIQEQFGGAQ